jgi:hypothetical protein
VVAKAEGFLSEHAALDAPTAIDENKTDGHGALIREFIQCVRDGTTPGTIGTDNIKSLAMVLGAVASAEQQRRVSIQL